MLNDKITFTIQLESFVFFNRGPISVQDHDKVMVQLNVFHEYTGSNVIIPRAKILGNSVSDLCVWGKYKRHKAREWEGEGGELPGMECGDTGGIL